VIDAASGETPVRSGDNETIDSEPYRPALAAGVELVGRLQGGGFAENQWLVRRGERFVQLTELLYRVAESADGRRSLDEMAAVVTDASPWLVTAEQIGVLVRTKLAPLGLVEPEAGAAPVPQTSAPALPLGLQIRARIIPAPVVDRVARPLRHLYWPPLVLALLVAAAAAHAWLFFSHGISQAALQVLYAPVLLLVILALLLVAAGFHELGHAAGLIYGGGRPGNMGAGFFLIYPAFYTDVSDSYRLSRWARLRTDLGGIYFHFVAALALFGLYFATGQEFLLLAVVLIDVEAIRQLIPFVRLDGYWAFADLTGIPDPFSLAAPFLRRFLPIPGQRLPPLKPWVGAVFAVFLALAIPALLFFLGLFVVGMPAFLSGSWDSAIHQLGELAQARQDGEGVAAAFAVIQLVLVALTVFAALFLVFAIFRSLIAPLRAWSAGRPRRQAAVGLGSAAAVGLLGLLWLPQLPLFASAPAGTESFFVRTREHVEGPIAYDRSPPVGGDHAPIWQNCGFYSTPIRSENGVHSMEHGAVWITYRPDLSASDQQTLRRIAQSQIHVLVTPQPGLTAPVVASSWGRQIRLDSANDPRLASFLRAFRLGPDAPERGGPCTGGTGQPE
jgi:putative peptide zinc metalloprotease protein